MSEWEGLGRYLMSCIDHPDFKSHLCRTGLFDGPVPESRDIYNGAYYSYLANSGSRLFTCPEDGRALDPKNTAARSPSWLRLDAVGASGT